MKHTFNSLQKAIENGYSVELRIYNSVGKEEWFQVDEIDAEKVEDYRVQIGVEK